VCDFLSHRELDLVLLVERIEGAHADLRVVFVA